MIHPSGKINQIAELHLLTLWNQTIPWSEEDFG